MVIEFDYIVIYINNLHKSMIEMAGVLDLETVTHTVIEIIEHFYQFVIHVCKKEKQYVVIFRVKNIYIINFMNVNDKFY